MGAPPGSYPSSCERQKSANQFRFAVYPGVLYIPGGCLGFLPSTVSSFSGLFGWNFKLKKKKVTVNQKYRKNSMVVSFLVPLIGGIGDI